MTMTTSPYPKISQLWRTVRISAVAFGAQSAAGNAHILWADRAAIAAVVVGAAEAAYRTAFPTGKLSGWVASLATAYRQIRAAATPAPPVVESAPAEPTVPATGGSVA